MIHTNPYEIELYSRCPKRLQFCCRNEEALANISLEEQLSLQGQIVKEIIKRVYWKLQQGHNPNWRSVLRAVDKQREKLSETMDPDEVYEKTKDILTHLHSWYDRYFSFDVSNIAINIPINIRIDNTLIYQDTIDILTIDGLNNVRLYAFSEKKWTDTSLYSNFVFQTKIWGFYRASETLPCEFIVLRIQPEVIEQAHIKVSKIVVERTEKMVCQIMRGIVDGAFYPSYSEQCKGCEWNRICGA